MKATPLGPFKVFYESPEDISKKLCFNFHSDFCQRAFSGSIAYTEDVLQGVKVSFKIFPSAKVDHGKKQIGRVEFTRANFFWIYEIFFLKLSREFG